MTEQKYVVTKRGYVVNEKTDQFVRKMPLPLLPILPRDLPGQLISDPNVSVIPATTPPKLPWDFVGPAAYYEIVPSGKDNCCERCQAMAGRVFFGGDYEEGVTAPPFHPNCGCTTREWREWPAEDAEDAAEGTDGFISFEDAIIKIARLVYAFEGSGYSKVTGNFDGQGISFGLLQWNIGQGSLQPLLMRMIAEHPELMKEIFADRYDEVSSMLNQSRSQQMDWARSINDTNNQILPAWAGLFETLGNSPDFQRIQIDAQESYVNQARTICEQYGLTTERGLALALDIAVQNWNVKVDPKITDDMTEDERLCAIASAVAEQANARWRSDVRDRKNTIAEGVGTVHGIDYDLLSDFDIGDRIIIGE